MKSSGAKFDFVDRQESFDILARSTEKRLSFIEGDSGYQDRNNHPISFLADGPGTGKSRFLDEVSDSFKAHIEARKSQFPLLEKSLKDVLVIRVTFGNDSLYVREDVEMGVSQALAIRILDPYIENARQYIGSWKPDNDLVLVHSLKLIMSKRKRTSSIFLCVDEVNKVHSLSPKDLNDLVGMLGSMSCSFRPFLVPILAGTVIDSIKVSMIKSSHPSLHIPLPLLSYESSLTMFTKTYGAPERNSYLRQLVADMGGHPRALEILLDCLRSFRISRVKKQHLHAIMKEVEKNIYSRYHLRHICIEGAVASAFLSLDVLLHSLVPGAKGLNYTNIAEMGIVKLAEDLYARSKVYIPFVFVSAWLRRRDPAKFPVVRLWADLLLGKDFWWQDWERFNHIYFAFRLSLYSYVHYKTLYLFFFCRLQIQSFF